MEAAKHLQEASERIFEVQNTSEYHGVKIPEAMRSKIQRELVLLFEEQMVFLDPKLTLTKLSGMIGTNTAYLSSMVNFIYQCNLPTLINHYRVDYAKRLFQEGKYNIKEVYKACGFLSRSAFYMAFQKETGFTPSIFVKHLNR